MKGTQATQAETLMKSSPLPLLRVLVHASGHVLLALPVSFPSAELSMFSAGQTGPGDMLESTDSPWEKRAHVKRKIVKKIKSLNKQNKKINKVRQQQNENHLYRQSIQAAARREDKADSPWNTSILYSHDLIGCALPCPWGCSSQWSCSCPCQSPARMLPW